MAELGLEPAEYIRLDLFPCTITGEDTNLGPDARLIVTDNHLYVFVDAPTGPEVVLKSPFSGNITGNITQGYQIGDFFAQKQATCGCGSRLRGIFPFLGVPHRPLI